ncbi:DUF3515 family protein [Microbacterium sp. RD1]|uniref:DUF3515 family protein n=1 Tax=Microbacterium sp. RD1 TaxID=3457313 RepID=UPI003FA5677B
MIRSRRLPVAAGILLVAIGMGGCAGTVSMKPAESAGDPACADVSVRLPQTVAGQDRRWTDAQATGAWGNPASVLLTCGVAVPGPSELPCQPVEGVDWLVDESEAADDRYTFTTFGRSPAVQVYIDYAVVGSADVLRALSPILDRQLEETGAVCTARPGTEETAAP